MTNDEEQLITLMSENMAAITKSITLLIQHNGRVIAQIGELISLHKGMATDIRELRKEVRGQ